MSLLKVPLFLSSAIAVHVACTPPNAPLSNDVVHKTLNEWIIAKHVKYWFPITKVSSCRTVPQAFCWTVALTEVAITASHLTDPNGTLPSVMQDAVGQFRMTQDMPITSPFLFGTALVVAGGVIRWWCFRTLGRFFTFNLSVRTGHQLVTTGPYAVVRHPSYTGTFMQSIGLLILHGSQTSLIRRSGVLNIFGLKMFVVALLAGRTIAMVSLVRKIREEEEVVKSFSGDEWETWAKVVKYWLIPGIY
ncbi:Isoprenylcysteine carboxyl methyltransferase family-domain-containing protein [Suillus ampliporus]|nr:Isoprenylcysteine carboxyl methyltransferase family-domain-containing protein [Suillus ampliporus]